MTPKTEKMKEHWPILPVIIGEAENLGNNGIYLEWETEDGKIKMMQGEFHQRYFNKGEHPNNSVGNKWHGDHKWICHTDIDEKGEWISQVWAQIY